MDIEQQRNNKKTKEKFSNLLNSRKASSDALSENSRGLLKDAVFQLISHYQDVNALLSEADLSTNTGQVAQSDQKDALINISVSDCVSLLKKAALESGKPLQILSAETLAHQILDILKTTPLTSGENLEPWMTPEQIAKISLRIDIISRLTRDQGFSCGHFSKIICTETDLPLQLLWMLHKEVVLSFDTYLRSKLSTSGFVTETASKLTCVLKSKDTDDPDKRACIAMITGCLVTLGYSEIVDLETDNLKKIAVGILDSVTKDLLDDDRLETMNVMPHLSLALIHADTDEVTMKRCCSHQIAVLLEHRPNLKVSHALKQQAQWTYAKMSEFKKSLCKQLLVMFTGEEVLDILRKVLEQQEVNWKAVLSFTSTFLVCFCEASKLLLDYIGRLLTGALDNAEMDNMIITFLLARQACLEGPHVCPPYADWFQMTFGNRDAACSKKAFIFLMKFLTNIVPFESAQHLKAHVTRPPAVPHKCRPLLDDYLILAKTRLADLEEPMNEGGIYESTSGSNKTEQNSLAESDVQKVLSQYESNGKVPSTVMEASIFRKPYFIGKFLPALLKARPLPDVTDVRMKFIEALHRCNKIPQSLYSIYEESCKKEAAMLVEGVFINEDSMEDMSMEPMDQLLYRLDQLYQIVTGDSHQRSEVKVAEIISLITEKIQNLLPEGSTRHTKPTVVDVLRCDLSSSVVQIVDVVVNAFCKTVLSALRNKKKPVRWAEPLLTTLLVNGTLQKTFLTRIWKLITEDGPQLRHSHVEGLAAMLVHLSSMENLFDEIRVKNETASITESESEDKISFCEQLYSCIPYNTGDWMTFSLRFCTAFIRYALSVKDRIGLEYSECKHVLLQPTLIKKFTYLCNRLNPGSRLPRTGEYEHSGPSSSTIIYQSLQFKEFSENNRLHFSSWLKMELSMCPASDVLSQVERLNYYQWVCQRHFMCVSVEDGGFGNSYSMLCSLLLRGLLVHRMGSESKVTCSHCSCGNHGGCRDNRGELLTALQQMVQLISVDDSSSLPWLQMEFMKHIENLDSEDIQLQSKVVTFMNIAYSLPPYLFFTNSLAGVCHTEHLITTARIISHYLRHFSSSFNCLPVELTVYLLQGLVTISRLGNGPSHCNVAEFFTHCPFFILSLLVHWPAAQPHVTFVLTSSVLFPCLSPLLKQLTELRIWAKRCCTERTAVDRLEAGADDWMAAVALFAEIFEGTYDTSSLIQTLQKQILKMLLEVVIGFVSASMFICQIDTRMKMERCASDILRSQPGFLSALLTEDTGFIQTNLHTKSAIKARPYVFMRLLIGFDVNDRKFCLQYPGNSSAILRLHQQICRQFEQGEVTVFQSEISMDVVKNSTKFVKECLSDMPLSCVRTVENDILGTCDPVLRNLVLHRLDTGS